MIKIIVVLLGLAGSAQAQGWDTVARPAAGPAEAIGGTANGCMVGAQQLPFDGPGWQAVRISRNRHWALPPTIEFVRNFAGELRRAGFPAIYIGDMAQPRGGRMPNGHASHQIGLDVDIWFNLRPKPDRPAAQREDIETPSLVRVDRSIDREVFEPRHIEMLRVAAMRPNVDRIFVNPSIKRELCQTVTGDRSWLRRLRPWYGHDSHFHVRLTCPPDSPECIQQGPLPPGDGCGEDLAWWFRPREPVVPPVRPPPRPQPPARCQSVLRGR